MDLSVKMQSSENSASSKIVWLDIHKRTMFSVEVENAAELTCHLSNVYRLIFKPYGTINLLDKLFKHNCN